MLFRTGLFLQYVTDVIVIHASEQSWSNLTLFSFSGGELGLQCISMLYLVQDKGAKKKLHRCKKINKSVLWVRVMSKDENHVTKWATVEGKVRDFNSNICRNKDLFYVYKCYDCKYPIFGKKKKKKNGLLTNNKVLWPSSKILYKIKLYSECNSAGVFTNPNSFLLLLYSW